MTVRGCELATASVAVVDGAVAAAAISARVASVSIRRVRWLSALLIIWPPLRSARACVPRRGGRCA